MTPTPYFDKVELARTFTINGIAFDYPPTGDVSVHDLTGAHLVWVGGPMVPDEEPGSSSRYLVTLIIHENPERLAARAWVDRQVEQPPPESWTDVEFQGQPATFHESLEAGHGIWVGVGEWMYHIGWSVHRSGASAMGAYQRDVSLMIVSSIRWAP